jgi:uncharacterized protein YqgC (DUF456 family)
LVLEIVAANAGGKMRKREIKADFVSDEGDFYKVERKSTKGVSAVAGSILGSFLAPGAGTVIGGLLGAIAGQDGKVDLIPKKDVTEIIEESSGHVRVVIDLDRAEGGSRT